MPTLLRLYSKKGDPLSGFPLMWEEEEEELWRGLLTQWPTCHMSEGIVDGDLCTWRVILQTPFDQRLLLYFTTNGSKNTTVTRSTRSSRVSQLILRWTGRNLQDRTKKQKACPFNGQSPKRWRGRAERGWAFSEREPSVLHSHPADVSLCGLTASLKKNVLKWIPDTSRNVNDSCVARHAGS